MKMILVMMIMMILGIIITNVKVFLIVVLPGAGQYGDQMSYWGREGAVTPEFDRDHDDKEGGHDDDDNDDDDDDQT